MHELPFTQHLLDLVIAHAEHAGGGRVRGVHVAIGRLSGISPECVALYWDVVARGTPAEGARLHVREVALTFVCGACGRTFGGEATHFVCPACGGFDVKVTSGGEQDLVAIDVDAGATDAAPAGR